MFRTHDSERKTKGRLGPALSGDSARRSVVDRLVAPVLVLLLVAIVAVGGVVAIAARSHDAIAARQAKRTVEASLNQTLQRLVATTADYANWNDAVDQLAPGDGTKVPDPDWVAANIGQTLSSSFGITAVLLLDDSGRVRLAIRDGEPQPLAGGLFVPDDVVGLARRARAAPEGQRGESAATVALDGIPHIAAAADLRWESTVARPQNGAVLVFLRRIDEDLLKEIAAPLAVGEIRMGASAETDGSGLVLKSPEGVPLGALIWDRPAPASEFLGNVLWLVLGIIGGMILLTGLFLSAAQKIAGERAILTDMLRDREIRLSRLIENLPELVALLKDGRVELLNDAGAAILGQQRSGSLVGRRLEDIVAPGDRDRVAGMLSEASPSADDGVWHDLKFLSFDGTAVPMRLRLLPLPELGPGALLAVARDLTAEKQAQEDLRVALVKADLADSARASFMSNISHELRTPLNAIIGFSQILKDELLGSVGNTHYKDYVNDIYEGGMHLLQLVNDLLDLARIDAGQFELREGWVDLSTLASRCVRVVHERATALGVTIECEIEFGGCRLLADELRLKQALVNLLRNAIKVSARGDTVRLSGGLDSEGNVVLRVSDRGPGMTPQEVAVALTAFGKVDDERHQQTPGLGLGLPLSKGYVEAHGGSLHIASVPGVGTTVILLLPRSRLYHPNLMRA